MKRDWGTIRKILEHVEAGDLFRYIKDEEFIADQISEDDLDGHLEILAEAGIIQNCTVRRSMSGAFVSVNVNGVFLTMAGHDLLDALRDLSVWSRIKGKARDAGVAISWEFIKAAIPAVMKELAG